METLNDHSITTTKNHPKLEPVLPKSFQISMATTYTTSHIAIEYVPE